MHRTVYFEVLDVMISQLQCRFCSKEFEMFTTVERVLSDSTSCELPAELVMKDVAKFYRTDFEESKLLFEMNIFYNHVKEHFQEDIYIFYNHVKEHFQEDILMTGSIKELAHDFISFDCKDSFPEVHKLFKIYLSTS